MPRIVISAARQASSEGLLDPSQQNPTRYAERLQAFGVKPFCFKAGDL